MIIMYNTQINLKSFSAYAIRRDIHKGCLADPPPVSVWKIQTLDNPGQTGEGVKYIHFGWTSLSEPGASAALMKGLFM